VKKIIIAFAAGQGLQLLINYLSHNMVYQSEQVWFCAGAGIIVLIAMIVGAWPTLWNAPVSEPRHSYTDHAKIPETVEATVNQIFSKRRKPADDMEEVAPLPQDVTVTNTSVMKGETA